MPLGRLLSGAAGLPVSAIRAVAGTVEPRRVHRATGRTHIPVRGVHRSGTEAMASALRRELLEVAGVARAEVNGPLGLVMVFHDDDLPVDELVGIVEVIERNHEVHTAPFAGIAHPPDGQALVREAALVGGYLVAGGAAIVGGLLRGQRVPPGVATLASMADASPQVRLRLEGKVGRTTTDWLIGTGVAVTHALAFQPTGPIINSAHRLIRLAEMRGHVQTWNKRSSHLDDGDGTFEAPALNVPPRPVPLPGGAVEHAAWTIPTAISGALGTYALTRDIGRAQGVLASGVPKAARLGREAFAAQIGIAASTRDAVVFQPEALRRLDRVDRIIVDVSALHTGGLVIDEVRPLSEDVAPEEAYERAYTLADLARLGARHKDGPWTVAPYKNGRDAKPMRDRGATVLMLTRDDEPVALVSVVAELDPLTEAMLATARGAGTVLVAGAGAGVRNRVTVDGTVAGGGRLLTSVRDLQEEGHVVMLVAARGGAALASADVGVGILSPSGHPPWGAHVLCGPGLSEVCLLLDALIPAREASARAARIAVVGSAAGALLAATGTPERSARRAQLAVDTAAVSALALGTWSGLSAGRRPAPLPADRTAWHAWPVQAVLDRLDSSMAGIAKEEADRRRVDTSAEAPAIPSIARVTIEELDNPLTPVLAAGAGVSAVVGSIMDAALIGSVLGVNAVMSGVQRVGADRALSRLVDMSAVRVKLRRPGEKGGNVTASELVEGDVVALSAGDAVPADCRLLSAQGLEVDEASLTGESQLVEKSARASLAGTVADRTSMLYEGSIVAAGEAVAVVVATGLRTEMGRTTRLGERPATSGVEERLRSLTKATLPIALGAGGALFLTDLMRGQSIARALGPAVSLAVAAVPEGLPFVATAAELATARRMSQRGAIVRNPRTIEALGRVDVLCFDKTGTLTMGRLRVRQVSDGTATTSVDSLTPVGRKVVAGALRASPEANGDRLPHPTDQAIMHTVADLGMDASEGLANWTRVDELPFEPARGYHAVLGEADGGRRLCVKGAPEIILDRCLTWDREDGPIPFDEYEREKVEQEIDRLARLGYRVLAVAERLASSRRDLTEERIGKLCLLGLVGIADPVRPTAAAAVARLRKAGVDIVMITGDHPTTAEAIAAELGVLNGGAIMTGTELDGMDDEELAEAMVDVSIFARVSPTQKARVVRALRAAGRVVAVTGDGANDAPAIRLADVGIALGEHATSAARETADIVITDERIETITDAIADCRAMWRSTRDALAVLLGGNLGEIAFTLGTGLISGCSPLNVRQLLLVNLLTDMLPAVALAARPPSGVSHEELITEGPEQSLGAALTRDIIIRASATAGAGMVAWLLGRLTGTRAQADTVGLVALVGTQLAQTVAAGGRDPVVLGAGFASFAALAVIVQVPGLSHFFGSRPLLPHGWAIGLGSATLFALAALLATRLTGASQIASPQVLEASTT